MEIKIFFARYLDRFAREGYLALAYALLLEILAIGFVVFAGLFTLETLLPTYITARLSLAKLFFLLLLSVFLLIAIGKSAGIRFTEKPKKIGFLLWGACVWGVGLSALSLYKFPLWSIPLLLILFAAISHLFWKLFSGEEKD
ncbi:MAG: hypothetical protein ABI747_02285 [Candidatus Moraniibacteriota bacterium]